MIEPERVDDEVFDLLERMHHDRARLFDLLGALDDDELHALSHRLGTAGPDDLVDWYIAELSGGNGFVTPRPLPIDPDDQ